MYEKAKKQLENKMDSFIFKPQRLYLPSSTFDLVTSRLALHYIEHLDTIFQNVFQTLKQMAPLPLAFNIRYYFFI